MIDELNNEEYLELFSNTPNKSILPPPVIDADPDDESDSTSATRKHISIKVRQSDLDALKKEAEKRGLRYQSLINSILHQYVTGRLKTA
jgi:uncharacterized protein (DUF4415 family)